MDFNLYEYSKMLEERNIFVIYSGPIWPSGIDGLAEFLQRKLDTVDLPRATAKSIFSVFVEQMHNMLMYSAEKEEILTEEALANVSRGTFVLSKGEEAHILKTGNVVTEYSAGVLKQRIDHLNTLDKQQLKDYFKQQLKADNDNPESGGGGIGLIEIARRAASKIEYTLTPNGDGLMYFTMSVAI